MQQHSYSSPATFCTRMDKLRHADVVLCVCVCECEKLGPPVLMSVMVTPEKPDHATALLEPRVASA